MAKVIRVDWTVSETKFGDDRVRKEWSYPQRYLDLCADGDVRVILRDLDQVHGPHNHALVLDGAGYDLAQGETDGKWAQTSLEATQVDGLSIFPGTPSDDEVDDLVRRASERLGLDLTKTPDDLPGQGPPADKIPTEAGKGVAQALKDDTSSKQPGDDGYRAPYDLPIRLKKMGVV